jgi:phospholipase C
VRSMKAAIAAISLLAALTVAAGGTTAAATPFGKIKHFVVMMQENRSFDHYFGHLADYAPGLGVEREPDTGNRAPDGGLIKPFHAKHYCEVSDLDHSWTGTHHEWNLGAMDGFATQNANAEDPRGKRAMGYYTEEDLPYYYDLYKKFAISDTFFSDVLDQTFPNRFYLLAGTSFGHIRNDFPTPPGSNPTSDFSQPTIFERLDAAGISWKVYFAQVPVAFLFGYVRNHAVGHVFPISQYLIDAKAGLLPQVSFVDPIFLGPVNVENDEHPPANVQMGQKFSATVINALMQSPNWKNSALILTYDEHGGYYDHMPPPRAVKPDAIPPMLQASDYVDEFDQLGIRVPVVVVSPWVKARHVSSALPLVSGGEDPVYAHPERIYSHSSILKTIENRFGLAPLTARDAASNDLSDFFDFTSPDYPTAPHMKAARVDPAEALFCELKRQHIPTDL